MKEKRPNTPKTKVFRDPKDFRLLGKWSEEFIGKYDELDITV
jgi:hypothetical protein